MFVRRFLDAQLESFSSKRRHSFFLSRDNQKIIVDFLQEIGPSLFAHMANSSRKIRNKKKKNKEITKETKRTNFFQLCLKG